MTFCKLLEIRPSTRQMRAASRPND